MTKQELYDAFDQKISKTCLVDDQTETANYMIQGKYCWIQTDFSYGDDVWDIHIWDPLRPEKGLGTKRMRNIASVLAPATVENSVRELTGEMTLLVQGKEIILDNLKSLGIRKKRELSPESVVIMTVRLAVSKGDKP